MTGFSSLDWNFAIRSRTALTPDGPALPDGDREGLSPGLSLSDVAEDAVPGGERLLDLGGLDVFLCSAAIRSERLTPALGAGCPLSLDLLEVTGNKQDQRAVMSTVRCLTWSLTWMKSDGSFGCSNDLV